MFMHVSLRSVRMLAALGVGIVVGAVSPMARAQYYSDEPVPAQYQQYPYALPPQGQPQQPQVQVVPAPQPYGVPQCTTTTTTTTTCTGQAAGLAVPGAVQAQQPPPQYIAPPPVQYAPPPQYAQPPPYYGQGPLWTEKTVVKRERRWGLFITGIAMFGVSYGSAAMLGSSSSFGGQYDVLKAPLIGPFWMAAKLGHDDCDSKNYYGECSGGSSLTGFTQGMMVVGGLAQMTGLALAIAGPLSFTTSKETQRVRVAIVPGPGDAGLAAVGSF